VGSRPFRRLPPQPRAPQAALRAGFDYGSEDYEAALRYLLDFGYLRPAAIVGGEGYSITSAGVGKLDEW
jgi:hypothetical protein